MSVISLLNCEQKDQVVFQQGSNNEKLYRVKKGKFRVEKENKMLAVLHPGKAA